MKSKPVITIDGPAGAGKSTISKLLASRLSFLYLDTGALYRAMAYWLKDSGWNGAEESVAEAIRSLSISLHRQGDHLRVMVCGQDVSDRIRSEEVGLLASRISAFPEVRRSLLSLQRQVASAGGVVAEGRDMGTVVFPGAEVKFFLDASPGERAKRRYLELTAKGEGVVLADIETDMRSRDRQDRQRAISPLKIPEGAIVVDSSRLSIPQVVDFMIAAIDRVCPLPPRPEK